MDVDSPATTTIVNHGFTLIEQAEQLEKLGDGLKALENYKKGIDLLNILLSRPSGVSGTTRLDIQRRMLDADTQCVALESRIQKLSAMPTATPSLHATSEPLPRRAQSQSIPRSQSSADLNDDDQIEYDVAMTIERVKTYILHPHQPPVQVNDGSFPLKLLVCRESVVNSKSSVILQLGPTTHFPLSEDIPCLRASPRHYVLPNIDSSYYGIAFPDLIPEPFVAIFEQQLEQHSCFKTDIEQHQQQQQQRNSREPIVEEPTSELVVAQPVEQQLIQAPPPTPAVSPTVATFAEGIEVGAKYVAQSLNVGSQYLKRSFELGGDYLASKLSSPTEDSQVSPVLQNTVAVAKFMSPVAVKVSKAASNAAGQLAVALGTAIADQIHKGIGSSGAGSPIMANAAHLGKATLRGVGEVWEGLIDAGATMLDGASNATTSVVEKRFGAEVSSLVKDGFDIGKDAYQVAANVKALGLKGTATRVGKGAAIGLARRMSPPANAIKGHNQDALGLPEGHSVVVQVEEIPDLVPQLEGEPLDDARVPRTEDLDIAAPQTACSPSHIRHR